MTAPAASLDLGLIGNGTIGALVDADARIVWGCMPAFDGDPAFCALLSPRREGGDWAVEVEGAVSSEQHYVGNTAVLRTVVTDAHGAQVEIVDFCPRWKQHDRFYRPVSIIRRLRALSGTPRVRVLLRPLAQWGAHVPEQAWGSNHVRFALPGVAVRLTTDAPLRPLRDGTAIVLDRELNFMLHPDETMTQPLARYCADAEQRTVEYWRDWVRSLSIPFDWQDAVIRSAITLKLCQYDDTGGIIAAMTTSIPEAAHTARNWDYRYCWLRDSAFVVRALNRLGATRTMEEYIRYIVNLATGENGELQPVYGIGYEAELHESEVESLRGYRGMGPVRRGNLAWVQVQHDSYGSVVLSAAQLFFDRRLARQGDAALFERLERVGDLAMRLYDQPDAGLWEFRGIARVHTYSAVMCWAACDRLGKIAGHLGLADRARHWHSAADAMRERILREAWHAPGGYFADAFGADRLDASLLLLADLGFIDARDPRFVATVDAVGRGLRHGDALYRYVTEDDFGRPETSFTICTFWYIDALAATGRLDEARRMFESVLARRNRLGLLSEDLAFDTGELWGNFPQTYSHVGLINAAMRLSRPWSVAT